MGLKQNITWCIVCKTTIIVNNNKYFNCVMFEKLIDDRIFWKKYYEASLHISIDIKRQTISYFLWYKKFVDSAFPWTCYIYVPQYARPFSCVESARCTQKLTQSPLGFGKCTAAFFLVVRRCHHHCLELFAGFYNMQQSAVVCWLLHSTHPCSSHHALLLQVSPRGSGRAGLGQLVSP